METTRYLLLSYFSTQRNTVEQYEPFFSTQPSLRVLTVSLIYMSRWYAVLTVNESIEPNIRSSGFIGRFFLFFVECEWELFAFLRELSAPISTRRWEAARRVSSGCNKQMAKYYLCVSAKPVWQVAIMQEWNISYLTFVWCISSSCHVYWSTGHKIARKKIKSYGFLK